MTAEERIQGRKIGIIGMARSGLAAAQLAKRRGGQPFVSDSARAELLLRQSESLRAASIPFESGQHTGQLLASDYIVVSPGVPPDIDILKQAQGKGIPVFSELEFASWVIAGPMVAVTGSNGKTTTTALIGAILSAAGRPSAVCGNIGNPLSDVADKVDAGGVAVIEVSTFQLEAIADFRPYIALILNLTADHLDRHGSFDTYKALKYRIAENQASEDYLVLNAEDAILRTDRIATRAVIRFFTTKDIGEEPLVFIRDARLWGTYPDGARPVIPVSEIRLPGLHNLQNAAAAVGAAVLLEIDPNPIAETLRSFAGVAHRLESLGSVAGVSFVNDSKATNIDSVCWALRSISTPIHLIAGGRDKGNDYLPLIQWGRDKIKTIVVIGEAADNIFNALGREFTVQFADSLEEAVRTSFDLAHPGETVLLSPGCASFDMFDNFEHRGEAFKAAVAGLKNGTQENQTVRS